MPFLVLDALDSPAVPPGIANELVGGVKQIGTKVELAAAESKERDENLASAVEAIHESITNESTAHLESDAAVRIPAFPDRADAGAADIFVGRQEELVTVHGFSKTQMQ